MLFRRRTDAAIGERLRTFFWPRRSFWRSAQYFIKRALRLTATPHAIAAGIAAGGFASFLPFIGFHFLLAAGLAWIIRGNLIASAFGTAVGNPLTFPFIWGATYELGRFLIEGREMGEHRAIDLGRMLRHAEFGQLWKPLLEPMTVGGTLLGLACGVALYIVTRMGVAAFQAQRREKIAKRATERSQANGAAAGG